MHLFSRYFLSSLSVHLLLFMVSIVLVMLNNSLIHEPKQFIPTYIYPLPSSVKTQLTSSGILKHVAENKMTRVHPRERSIKSIRTEIKNENELLRLLHELIARKQSYPESAQLLQQTGTVAIGFYLHPNGNITEARVIKTSGVSSLDEAAVAAVVSAVPVSFAHTFLSQVGYLKVEVQFTLE